MTGFVDDAGRALVQIAVRPLTDSQSRDFEAWIDTGFTGELVLPQAAIDELALIQSGSVNAELGDGSIATLATYTCTIEWLGQILSIEVVANTGSLPLLGVGLLTNRTLTIDYARRSLAIV